MMFFFCSILLVVCVLNKIKIKKKIGENLQDFISHGLLDIACILA